MANKPSLSHRLPNVLTHEHASHARRHQASLIYCPTSYALILLLRNPPAIVATEDVRREGA